MFIFRGKKQARRADQGPLNARASFVTSIVSLVAQLPTIVTGRTGRAVPARTAAVLPLIRREEGMPNTELSTRRVITRCVYIVAFVLLASAAHRASGRMPGELPASPAPLVNVRAPAESLLWIEIRNVTMHLDARATIRVRRLRGEMRSTAPGQPAVLDDRNSFDIRVTSGTVGLTGEDLTTLLNDFVFAYRGAPLRNLRARPNAGQVSLTGTMHKGVDLHFDITSAMTLTPEGMIRLHPTKTEILGIDGQKLMHALGLHLDDLLDLKGSHGATVKGDDIYLDPAKILPPPAIVGSLASAQVLGSEVVIQFKSIPDDSIFGSFVRPDSTIPNFVYFRGGRLRFGKLLMDDTDLAIVDADPSDVFDLNLEEYAKQLVASTSHTLANQGLRVDMPDYDSLGKQAAGGESRRAGPPRGTSSTQSSRSTIVGSTRVARLDGR
jgi:hypothetical protein